MPTSLDHQERMLKHLDRQRACAAELLEALKIIRDQTLAVQHSQETRLNDIYDLASDMIKKIEAP